jgi:hypothetical protein
MRASAADLEARDDDDVRGGSREGGAGRRPTELFIGGQWRPASGGGTLTVDDPATGEALTEVADASVEDGRAPWTPPWRRRRLGAAPPARPRRDPAPRFEMITDARRRPAPCS